MGSFSNQLAFGQIGEGYIAQWLICARGWTVLPVYEKQIDTGKGPTWYTNKGALIAPDLLCMKRNEQLTENRVRGQIRWVEAKTKTAFTWHRKSSQWTTGIDRRHYEDYLKVDELSMYPVWLLFLHLDGTAKDTPEGMQSPTGLFGGSIKRLSKHVSHASPNHGKSGMVYWAHNTLTQLATLDEVLQAATDSKGKPA